jgi:hypothetical protein
MSASLQMRPMLRADGGARCKCAVYKRLFVKKTAA